MNTDQGHSTCPNCQSDDWKSAKMVVLEGVSFADGELAGTVTKAERKNNLINI